MTYQEGEVCERCDYAEKTLIQNQFECRRHSPIMGENVGEDVIESVWPDVYTGDWCGDFKLSREIAMEGKAKR